MTIDPSRTVSDEEFDVLHTLTAQIIMVNLSLCLGLLESNRNKKMHRGNQVERNRRTGTINENLVNARLSAPQLKHNVYDKFL